MTILTKPPIIGALLALFIVGWVIGGPANAIEAEIMRSMAEIRSASPSLTAMAGGVTALGSAYVTLGVASLASLWLLLHRAPARALMLALIVLTERLLVDGLKEWIGRARPDFGVNWLPHSMAFPSGHSANSMTAFLATALILAPPEKRGPWATGAVVLAVVVGLSRIYLGVHWPSDVVGGWTLGLLAVSSALAVGQRSGALRFEPQHQIVGGHRPAGGEDEAA